MHFRYVQKISVRKSTILCKQLDNSYSILNKTQDFAVQSATTEQCRRRRPTQQPSRSRSMPAREISKSRFHQPDYNVSIAKQASSTTHLMKVNGQNPQFHSREYSTFIEKLKNIFGIGATPPPPLQRSKDDIVTRETPQNPPVTKKVEDDIDFEKAMGASKPKVCPNKTDDPQFSMPYAEKLDGPADDSTFFSEERICKECPELRAYKLQRDYDLKQARHTEKESEEPDSKDMYEAEEGQEGRDENAVYTSEAKDEEVACDKSLKCKRKVKEEKGGDCDANIVSDQQLNYAVLSDKEKTLIDGQYSTQHPLVGNCTTTIQHQPDWKNHARHINLTFANDLCGLHAKKEELKISLDNRNDETQLVDVIPVVRKPRGRNDNGLLLCGMSDKLASDTNLTDCTREEASLSTLDRVLASLQEIETKQKRLDEDGGDYKDDGLFPSLQHQAFVSLQKVDTIEFPAPPGASMFIPDVIELPERLKRSPIDHQNLPSPNVYSQLPAVIPQVATQLALPDIKRQLKREIKKEIKQEMKNEVKREVTQEIKQEVKYDLTKDFKDNLKQDLKMECLMEEVKREMKTDLRDDLREDLKNEVKGDLRLDLQKDVKAEIQEQVKAVLQDESTIMYADEEDDRKEWEEYAKKKRNELSDKVKNVKEEWDEKTDHAAEAAKRHAYELQQDAKVVGAELKKSIEETDWEGKKSDVEQTAREVADKAKAAQEELTKLEEKIEEEKKKRGGNNDFSVVDDVVIEEDLKTLLALKVDKDINIQRKVLEEDETVNQLVDEDPDQKVVEEESSKQQEEIESIVVEEKDVKKTSKNVYECEEFTTESLRRELQLMKCSLGHNNIGVKFFDGITRVPEKPPAAIKVRLNQPEPMSYQVGADNLLKQIKKLQESKIKSTRRESMLFIEQVKDSLKWDFGEKYTKEVIQINPDLKTSTTRILPQDPAAPYSQIYVKLNDFKIMSVQADVRKKDGRMYTGFLKENARKLLSPIQNLTDIQKRDSAKLNSFEHYNSGLLLPLIQNPSSEQAETLETPDHKPGEPERNLKQRSRIPIRDPSGDLRIRLDFFQNRPPDKPDPKQKVEKPKRKGLGGFIKNLMKTVETTFSPPPPPKPKPPCKEPPPPPPPPQKPPAQKAKPKIAAKAEAKADPGKKEPVDLAKVCPPPNDGEKEPCPKIQDIPLPKPKEAASQEKDKAPKVQASDAGKDGKKPCKKPWEEHVRAQGSLDKKDEQTVKDYKEQEAKKHDKKEDPKDKKVEAVKASDKKPQDPKQAKAADPKEAKDAKKDAKDQKPVNKCDQKPEESKPADPCEGDIGEKSFMQKVCEKEPPQNKLQLEKAKKAKEKALKDKELEDKKRRSSQYLEPKDIPCNPTIIDTSLLTNPCCRKFPDTPVEGNMPGQLKFVKSNFERAMLKEEKLLKELQKPVSSAKGVVETEPKTLCNIRGTALKATEEAAETSDDMKMCIHDKKVPIHDCPICRKSQILDSPPKPMPKKATCKIGKCRKKGSKESISQSSICSQLETASANSATTCGNKLKKKPPIATQKCPKPQFNVVCEKPKMKPGKPGLCGITCYMKPCARKKKPPPPPPKKLAAAPKPGTCPTKKKPKKAKKVVQQTPKAKVVAILDEAIQQQRAKKCFKVKAREGKPDDCIKVVSACEKKVLAEERRKQLEKELAERKLKERELKKMKHTPWVPVKVRVSDNKFICKKPFPAEKRKIKEEEERQKTKRHHVLPDLSSKWQSPRFSKKCDEKKQGAQAGGGQSKK